MHPVILIITHSPICHAMLQAIKSMGIKYNPEEVLSFDIQNGDLPENKAEEIHRKLSLIAEKAEVLILTDLPGATPYNIAKSISALIKQTHTALISGINLAMLLRAINYQKKVTSAIELANIAIDGATKAIIHQEK